MKPVDEQINRLLKAASQAPKPAAGDPPFGLETRVLAHWRASARAEGGEFLVMWFRRVTIGAAILAVASMALGYFNMGQRSSTEMVADSAMTMGVEP
jgi:hypothetical protein